MKYLFIAALSVLLSTLGTDCQELKGHCVAEQFRLDLEYPNTKPHYAEPAYIWTDNEGSTHVGSWHKIPEKFRPR